MLRPTLSCSSPSSSISLQPAHPSGRRSTGTDRSHRPTRWLSLGLLACLWLAGPSPGLALEGTDSTAEHAWERSGVRQQTWTLDRAAGEHDRIRVHRYFDEAEPADAALLYLPGTNMNGVLAEDDPDHSLWLWLAQRGVEVWTLDYRTHTIPPDASPDGLAFMAEWSMEAFTEDARAALGILTDHDSGGLPIYVAGFSRGVAFAYALACLDAASPEPRLAGLVALDGAFKRHTLAGGSPEEMPLREAVETWRRSGRRASDVAAGMGWEARDRLMRAVIDEPSAPPTRPGAGDDAPATIGEQLARLLYGAWRPGGLAHPIGAGTDRGVSRPEVLASLLAGYDRWYPARQDVEGGPLSSVADHSKTAIDDAWGELDMPILWFGASGMGTEWLLDGLYSAARSGSSDVEVHVLEGFGHLDVLVAESAPDEVYSVVLDWIERHAPGNEEAKEGAP